jgi:hypothetical protein
VTIQLLEFEKEDVKRIMEDYQDAGTGYFGKLHPQLDEVVERIGEIYDVARARVLRDAA